MGYIFSFLKICVRKNVISFSLQNTSRAHYCTNSVLSQCLCACVCVCYYGYQKEIPDHYSPQHHFSLAYPIFCSVYKTCGLSIDVDKTTAKLRHYCSPTFVFEAQNSKDTVRLIIRYFSLPIDFEQACWAHGTFILLPDSSLNTQIADAKLVASISNVGDHFCRQIFVLFLRSYEWLLKAGVRDTAVLYM